MDQLWIYLALVVASIVFGYRAIVSSRILISTLYLAGISAMTAVLLYMLGAYQVAAIELSVGAGLVTVLLVFAISVVGDDAYDPPSIIKKPIAFIGVGLIALMLGAMALPIVGKEATMNAGPLSSTLWEQRVLDLWIQMVLIFSGTMGMLGVLAEGKSRQRSGLHVLTEIEGQEPRSDLYKKIPLGVVDESTRAKVESRSTQETAWVKPEPKRSVNSEEKK